MKQRRDFISRLRTDILTVVKSMTAPLLTVTSGVFTNLTTTNFILGSKQLATMVQNVTMVVGSEAADAITVTCQFVDSAGTDLASMACLHWFLSDDSGGDSISAGAPSAGVAAGTDGALIAEYVANLSGLAQCEADGDLDIVLSEAGAATWYLVFVLPDGSQVVSGAITFA